MTGSARVQKASGSGSASFGLGFGLGFGIGFGWGDLEGDGGSHTVGQALGIEGSLLQGERGRAAPSRTRTAARIAPRATCLAPTRAALRHLCLAGGLLGARLRLGARHWLGRDSCITRARPGPRRLDRVEERVGGLAASSGGNRWPTASCTWRRNQTTRPPPQRPPSARPARLEAGHAA